MRFASTSLDGDAPLGTFLLVPEAEYGIGLPINESDVTGLVADLAVLTATDTQIFEDIAAIGAPPLLFDQMVASDTWVIAHTFPFHPVVTVWDNNGDVVDPDIEYQDPTHVVIRFAFPYTGTAQLT